MEGKNHKKVYSCRQLNTATTNEAFGAHLN